MPGAPVAGTVVEAEEMVMGAATATEVDSQVGWTSKHLSGGQWPVAKVE